MRSESRKDVAVKRVSKRLLRIVTEVHLTDTGQSLDLLRAAVAAATLLDEQEGDN